MCYASPAASKAPMVARESSQERRNRMIYKRGKSYWFEFCWKGERVRRPTKVGNPNAARRIESAYRTKLANDEVDIRDRGAVPTLAAFAAPYLLWPRLRSDSSM